MFHPDVRVLDQICFYLFWYWMHQLLLASYPIYMYILYIVDSLLTISYTVHMYQRVVDWEAHVTYMCAIRLEGLTDPF